MKKVSVIIGLLALSSIAFSQVELPKWKLDYTYSQTISEKEVKYNNLGVPTDTIINKGVMRFQNVDFFWFPGEFNDHFGIIAGWKSTFDYTGDSLLSSSTQIVRTPNRLDCQRFFGGLRWQTADDNSLVYSVDLGYFYQVKDYYNSTRRVNLTESGLFLAGKVSYYNEYEPWLSEIHLGINSNLPLNSWPLAAARETSSKISGQWTKTSARVVESSRDYQFSIEVKPYRWELNNDVLLSPVCSFQRNSNDFSLGSYTRNTYSIGIALSDDIHSDFLRIALNKSNSLTGFSVTADLAPLMRWLKK
jgi:hypothetical protein